MKENYLLIMLESVRYDVFMKSDAPNIKSLGTVEKVYSPTCWTVPAFVSLFIIPSYIGHKNILPFGPFSPEWVPSQFQKEGYYTVFLTSNPWIKAFEVLFAKGFDEFIFYKENHHALPEQIEDSLERMNRQPFFHVIHVLETHINGGYSLEKQAEFIGLVDQKLAKLFRNTPRGTRVIVTSDHGESSEVPLKYHNPAKLDTFEIGLFEVPLVIGKV